MTDMLLELSPRSRKIIKTLGLPVPMPQRLARAKGPWEERPLHDEEVFVGSTECGVMSRVLARTLVRAGASTHVTGGNGLSDAFAEPGEAYGRPAQSLDFEALPGRSARALIFDATGIAAPGDLRYLYDFFHPLVRKLGSCGRVVVIGRPPEAAESVLGATTAAALEGLTRSMAKELGKRGSTAQLIHVEEGAEARVEPVLRFVLSRRSAYMTGQVIRVSSRVGGDHDWVPNRLLDGKVALVTGAARGIGSATAELLAAEGAHVVCLDRPQDDGLCSQVAHRIGGEVLLVDVSADDAPATIAGHLADKHGGVDVVVHNAGITRDKTLAKMKPEAWEQTIDVNLAAVARITDALVGPDGPMRDGGRIVCLSSIAGIAGNMGQTNYAASKAGIIGFVRKQAEQLAARGITVNAVAPGFIETRMTATIPMMIRQFARRLTALGQGGVPQDVGEVITFLSTPGAVGVTSNVLRVCGGSLVGA